MSISVPKFTISESILTELQSSGIRLVNDDEKKFSRVGGAGPSDLKAVKANGITMMVQIYSDASASSPFHATKPDVFGVSMLYKHDELIGPISFPKQPKFYDYKTSDGIPLKKIATLHSENVLASTVLQNCIRYSERSTSCQFCAIGESLLKDQTIAYKKPHHLAEVAEVAKSLDNVEQFVLTTGTPASSDRGAKILFESVTAIKNKVDIPIQVQCEPPDDFIWFQKLKDAGADSIGMHLEAVTQDVRKRIMPGKAEVSLEYYYDAFKAAVPIFGKGNVSTYILAGLGDLPEDIIRVSKELIEMGVYPFVVPFVPINGTPLQNRPSPSSAYMEPILREIGESLNHFDMNSEDTKAGCAKCGACSTLKQFEKKKVA